MIRPFLDEDALGVAELLTEGLEKPWVITAADVLHRQDVPARAHRAAWVAVEEAEIVGWANAELRWEASEPGVGELWAAVGRTRRGRGVGSALIEQAESHLRAIGAKSSKTWSEEEEGKRLLRARGYRETRGERISALDPRAADLSALPELEASKKEEGFGVVPLRDVLDRPRDLYDLYMAGEADMPGDHPEDNIAFEDWQRTTLATPSLDREGSFVVLHGARPVSIAWLEVDRERKRATNEMTATLPEFRRRGLARLAKLVSIRWAAERGITSILTSNDRENLAMLALNDALGYRPTAVRNVFVRDLTV